jgi:hypothetical protein
MKLYAEDMYLDRKRKYGPMTDDRLEKIETPVEDAWEMTKPEIQMKDYYEKDTLRNTSNRPT